MIGGSVHFLRPRNTMVKSARRVIEILELFDESQSGLSVGEVAGRLGYPQSSTSEILRTLHGMGYLSYDAKSRQFSPTLMVSLLGDWVHHRVLGDLWITSLTRELGGKTGGTISLAVQYQIYAKYIRVLRPSFGPTVPGLLRPLCRSAVGKMLLSTLADNEIGKIIRRANALAKDPKERVNPGQLLKEVERIRVQRYAQTASEVIDGAGAIAVLLPIRGYPQPVALGVGGPVDFIGRHSDAILEAMRAAIRKYTSLH